jgi:hypothetical protein
VIVTLRDGQVLSRRMRDLIPATHTEIRERFRLAAGTEGSAIEKMVGGLESLADVSVLSAVIGRTRSGGDA